MDTQALIARLRERAATQDACGCWSLDKVAADELDRLRTEVDRLVHAVAARDELLGKLTKTLIEEVNRHASARLFCRRDLRERRE